MPDLPTTPLPEFEAAKLVLALAPSFVPGIGREGARLILAHNWGLETRRGQAVHGHNVGNIMAKGFRDGKEYTTQTNKYWKGDFWRPPWFDDPTHKLHAKMLEGKAPSAFRSYDSFKDGMSDYLALVAKKVPLRQGLLDGRAFEYAQGVWDSGYCRDKNCEPAHLQKVLKKLAHEFAEKNYFNSLPSTARASGGNMLLAAGVLGTAGLIFWGTVKGKKR